MPDALDPVGKKLPACGAGTPYYRDGREFCKHIPPTGWAYYIKYNALEQTYHLTNIGRSGMMKTARCRPSSGMR